MGGAAVAFEIQGRDQFLQLATNLQRARQQLLTELNKGVEEELKKLPNQLRASAIRTLPTHGGLDRRVAASSMTVVRRPGGVRLATISRDSLRQLDRGHLRHPVFGNRQKWVPQRVPEGWWTKPVEAAKPGIQRRLAEALDRVGRRVR